MNIKYVKINGYLLPNLIMNNNENYEKIKQIWLSKIRLYQEI